MVKTNVSGGLGLDMKRGLRPGLLGPPLLRQLCLLASSFSMSCPSHCTRPGPAGVRRQAFPAPLEAPVSSVDLAVILFQGWSEAASGALHVLWLQLDNHCSPRKTCDFLPGFVRPLLLSPLCGDPPRSCPLRGHPPRLLCSFLPFCTLCCLTHHPARKQTPQERGVVGSRPCPSR